jgi:oligopeptide transport system ATP-binding protein
VFIAHDLAVVRQIAHRVGVMYLGRLVETAPKSELYANPRHPYTQALLSAAPIPDPVAERERKRIELHGEVPSPEKIYAGCSFADRCPIAEQFCRESPPVLEGGAHQAACFKAER